MWKREASLVRLGFPYLEIVGDRGGFAEHDRG